MMSLVSVERTGRRLRPWLPNPVAEWATVSSLSPNDQWRIT